ncbi:MAG: dihydroneopterin aldolase [Verrucomicrobiota bacterium]
MSDEILIGGLQVEARVGVPEDERASPQGLEVDIRMVPAGGFGGMEDDVARTVDYDEVAQRVRAKCGAGEWALIESLAGELAGELLGGYELLERVEVEVRKFVIPDCGYVGVRVGRERGRDG